MRENTSVAVALLACLLPCACAAGEVGGVPLPRSREELALRFREAVASGNAAGVVALVWERGVACGDNAVARRDLETALLARQGRQHAILFDTAGLRAIYRKDAGIASSAYSYSEWFKIASGVFRTEVEGDAESGTITWSSTRLPDREAPPAISYLRVQSGAYVIVYFGRC